MRPHWKSRASEADHSVSRNFQPFGSATRSDKVSRRLHAAIDGRDHSIRTEAPIAACRILHMSQTGLEQTWVGRDSRSDRRSSAMEMWTERPSTCSGGRERRAADLVPALSESEGPSTGRGQPARLGQRPLLRTMRTGVEAAQIGSSRSPRPQSQWRPIANARTSEQPSRLAPARRASRSPRRPPALAASSAGRTP